jgi:hypothetical protein
MLPLFRIHRRSKGRIERRCYTRAGAARGAGAQDIPLLPSRITGREEGLGEVGWDGKWNAFIPERKGNKQTKREGGKKRFDRHGRGMERSMMKKAEKEMLRARNVVVQ